MEIWHYSLGDNVPDTLKKRKWYRESTSDQTRQSSQTNVHVNRIRYILLMLLQLNPQNLSKLTYKMLKSSGHSKMKIYNLQSQHFCKNKRNSKCFLKKSR